MLVTVKQQPKFSVKRTDALNVGADVDSIELPDGKIPFKYLTRSLAAQVLRGLRRKFGTMLKDLNLVKSKPVLSWIKSERFPVPPEVTSEREVSFDFELTDRLQVKKIREATFRFTRQRMVAPSLTSFNMLIKWNQCNV